MSDAPERASTNSSRQFPRLLGIFAAWRLQAYGYTIAALYAAVLIYVYSAGAWIVDSTGAPRLNDFTAFWIAGTQAAHGETGSLYDPAEFAKIQMAVVGPDYPRDAFYPNWPYPPIFFLILAPLAMLPYPAAFLTFEFVTLAGYTAIVYLIVRRPPAIALALASPFTFWNFFIGHTGFLRAALLGASLLFLERQPVLAGLFIGSLVFKPQFGILLPVALVAAKQWRAFASAATTIALLTGASVAAFGTGPWEAFPRELVVQTGDYLVGETKLSFGWTFYQTVYGLIHALHGGAALAWIGQGVATIGVAIIVWLVWRSPVRYSLKAAALSAAVLIATPYAWAYDMAAIAIPLAFLARDQIRCGLLRGEQTVMLALFAAGLVILVCLGNSPLGPVMMITLLAIVLRRVLGHDRQPMGEFGNDRNTVAPAADQMLPAVGDGRLE